MKYLRFGEVPVFGKSVNFLKLTIEQNEDFTYRCENSSYGEACAELPADAFEVGLSVFEIDENGMPRLDSLQLVSSMLVRLDAKIYEVTGEQVGTGNDGEPLVKVNEIKENTTLNKESLIKHAISTLCKNFKNAEYNRQTSSSDYRIRSFYVEEKVNTLTGEKVSIWEAVSGDGWVNMPPRREYLVCGWTFSSPADGFNVKLGFKG